MWGDHIGSFCSFRKCGPCQPHLIFPHVSSHAKYPAFSQLSECLHLIIKQPFSPDVRIKQGSHHWTSDYRRWLLGTCQNTVHVILIPRYKELWWPVSERPPSVLSYIAISNAKWVTTFFNLKSISIDSVSCVCDLPAVEPGQLLDIIWNYKDL